MKTTTVVPLTSFVHGSINAHEGKAFNCEKSLADDLERSGLVRVKRARLAPADVRLEQKAAAGKAQDDGAGQPSSVSPAAPASAMKTSKSRARGTRRSGNAGA